MEEGRALSDLLAVCVVCQKQYDEMESCGSAAHFISGEAINAGKAHEREGGGEGEIGPELEVEEEGGGGDLVDFLLDNDITKSKCASSNHTHGLLPPDIALPQPTYGSPPGVALPHKRKMPCSGRCWAGDAVSSDSVVVVKRLNKKQLQQRLDCNTKKLKCAEKKVAATRKKLITTKEHCKQFASLAQDRQKDSPLAHLNAERKESAIRAELDNAQRRINDITADVHDRIIEEQASNSAQAKSKVASAKKRHQTELN